jgi:hypothetical protein
MQQTRRLQGLWQAAVEASQIHVLLLHGGKVLMPVGQ